MTAKCSPFIFPTSSRFSRPWSPTATASAMSSGMSRFDAKRFAVPAGRIASRASVPAIDVDAALHHAVATPDEDRLGAVGQCLLDALGRVACSSGPRSRADRLDAGVPRAPHAAPRVRLPSTCPACAMTATRVMPALPRRGCAQRARVARATNTMIARAARPMRTPAPTSVRWCMPRYMRAHADEQRNRDAHDQRGDPERGALDPRREEQEQSPP